MKTLKPLLLLLLAAFAAFVALTPPHARAQVSVSFFYDTLDPYGEWVQAPGYGYVWHPTAVDENWAPYTDGYWAYTDSGWTWVSYEDYGGVVYHYGRWTRLSDEGWVWVPGYTWAPAWVSWRTGGDYIGWAPLPPEAAWSVGIGFSSWVDARFDIGPGCYSFVGVRDFGAPALGAVILSREQNVNIINNTTNITNITVNNSNVYVGGPSYARLAGRTARPIPTLKLVRQRDASLVRSQGGKALSRQQGNSLMVIAPKVTAPPAGSVPAPSKVAKTLTGGNADHGWNVVKDPDEREKLRAHIKDQAGSNTSAPAKAVSSEDVKLVDERIKAHAASKTAAAAPSPTPKAGKGKNKTPSTADLLNAPATEEPGASKAAETPKTGKGKSKKGRTPESSYSDTGAGNAEQTPIPIKSKSKKARTPSYEETGSPYGSEAPSKHSKKNNESNLQPFMGGDESPEPKSKENPDYSGGYPKTSDKSYEGRPSEAGYPATEARPPKGEKNDKKDKKRKEEQEGYPPGQ